MAYTMIFQQNLSKQHYKLNMEAGKTTFILITQKFAPLKLVDRIIVINNALIIADGPRDEILQALNDGSLKKK
jgi:ATP-binding cassette, subfamily C, bacterial LapB